ncbi:MAG: hypothetical protein R2746_02755 [Acidimicrobiales bacterium]
MADRRPGWGADEGALRRGGCYRSPQQHRSVETTRRMLGAAWDAMAAHPAEPLRLEEVLDGADTSASSFYARFDGIDTLVEVAGLLALTTTPSARRRPIPWARARPPRPCWRRCWPGAPCRSEVLAVGLWSEPLFVAAPPPTAHRRFSGRRRWPWPTAARTTAGRPPGSTSWRCWLTRPERSGGSWWPTPTSPRWPGT